MVTSDRGSSSSAQARVRQVEVETADGHKHHRVTVLATDGSSRGFSAQRETELDIYNIIMLKSRLLTSKAPPNWQFSTLADGVDHELISSWCRSFVSKPCSAPDTESVSVLTDDVTAECYLIWMLTSQLSVVWSGCWRHSWVLFDPSVDVTVECCLIRVLTVTVECCLIRVLTS